MSSHILSSGESFQTIILPKGTVLFRGMDLHTDRPHPEYIFSDLFGAQDDDGYYCTDPHENKFFYLAPFVSDSVNRYAIHAVYITNYDIELVTMLKPSANARSKRGTLQSPYLRCSDISSKDTCGRDRKQYDPCLSPQLLKEFPHIQGFIAIAEKDTMVFQKGQIPAFMANVPGAAETVRPFIVSNSRGLQGVPEIVLFPYHARPEGGIFEKIVVHPRAPEPDDLAYAIRHRSALNYFPLAYVTENGYYSFKELLDSKKRRELASAQRDNINFDSPIVTNMHALIHTALSPKGLFVNGVPYKFTIDLRTGFYVCDMHREVRKLNYTTHPIQVATDGAPQIVPFHFPREYKKKIHASLSKAVTEDSLERNLNNIYASYSKHYQFNRGDPVTFKKIYKMEMAIPRPELAKPIKRFTRKAKRNAVPADASASS